jgi:hypothetical protein
MARRKKNKVEVASVRDTLVHYFEEKAAYRESLVERFPWHAGKNSGYAQSLGLMAKYVGGLPDDDPTLLALARCPHLYCPEADLWDLPNGGDGCPTSADTDVIHCGPRGEAMAPGECAEWFAGWAEGVMAEAKALSESSRDVTEELG